MPALLSSSIIYDDINHDSAWAMVGSGKVSVQRWRRIDGRDYYNVQISDRNTFAILHDSCDQSTPPGAGPLAALAATLGFLSAAADAYAHQMRNPGFSDPENLHLFNARTTEFAYIEDAEIACARAELDELGYQ